MTVILPDSLLHSDVLYLSFRLSLIALMDRLMGESLQLRAGDRDSECFLERFPLLDQMAPQIQLECLLTSWDRIQARQPFSLLDEAVCAAATDLLCEMSAANEQHLMRMAWSGPRTTTIQRDHWLCSHVRSLQVALLPSRRTWLLDVVPSIKAGTYEAILALSAAEQQQRGELLSLLGRWRTLSDLQNLGTGLTTKAERDLLRAFFEEHRGLLG